MKIIKLFITAILLLSVNLGYSQNRRVLLDTCGADSIIQTFHKNGQLFYQVPYKNGVQNGWYEQYHENGAIWVKYYTKDGKVVDGYSVALHDNGNIYQEGKYKNGRPIGKWYCYSSAGEPFKIYYYNRKGYIKKVKEWDEEKNKWVKTRLA